MANRINRRGFSMAAAAAALFGTEALAKSGTRPLLIKTNYLK